MSSSTDIEVVDTNTGEGVVAQTTEAESLFALLQRQAQALAVSDLVPVAYRDNVPNCMLALELAERTHSSAFMVMQNVYRIQGKPSWSSQFIIAAINACGRFSPLRYTLSGDGMTRECFAWAKDLSDGCVLEGPVISMEMAKAEGWLNKSGSKWKTMPELMIRYRSAAFFGRLYAPEILMGMHSKEEVEDWTGIEVPSGAAALEALRDITPDADAVNPITQEPKESNPALESEPPPGFESGKD